MSLYFGTQKIKGIYIGEQKVKSAYLGGDKIFSTGGGSRIPDEYQEVTYISASASNGAYIDLGVQFTGRGAVELWYQRQTPYQHIFGAASNSNNRRWLLTAGYQQNSDGTTGTMYTTNAAGKSFVNNCYPDSTIYKVGDILKYRFELYSDYLTVKDLNNDATVTSTYVSGDVPVEANLFLFGQNYSGAYRGNGLKVIYYCKLWDRNHNVVREMIPCYRKADGTIGMYDTVSKTFYTNAGTGAFVKGPEVT